MPSDGISRETSDSNARRIDARIHTNMLSFACTSRRFARRMATSSRIVFSGIQPSGVPHIGNYFGALKNWVKEQNEGGTYIRLHLGLDYKKSYFGIMSYHALTSVSDPALLRDNIKSIQSIDCKCLVMPSPRFWHVGSIPTKRPRSLSSPMYSILLTVIRRIPITASSAGSWRTT